jgi:hypothetical protein
MAVTSGKHSEHDTETACFVICTLLEPLRHRKLHCTPWSVWTCSTDAMCVQFAEDFRSMWSPHRWSVWVGCLPLGHIRTAQCSTGSVALSRALFKFRWNFLCSYCSVTDWQHRSDWCSADVCTESDESIWPATAEISQVYPNISPIFYQYILPSDFRTTIFNIIFIPPKRLTCTTNLTHLKPITIFSILLLTSPSYLPISPSAPHS